MGELRKEIRTLLENDLTEFCEGKLKRFDGMFLLKRMATFDGQGHLVDSEFKQKSLDYESAVLHKISELQGNYDSNTNARLKKLEEKVIEFYDKYGVKTW